MKTSPLPRTTRCFPSSLVLLLLFLGNLAAQAASTNLIPIADTALRSAIPDVSLGSGASLPVGVAASGNPINHSLFRFPVEQIPANATITQATLRLASTVVNPNTQLTANYDLFRLLKNWNESETTWNTRLAPGVGWGLPGAQAGVDFVSSTSGTTAIAPATVAGPSLSLFSSAQILADIELWRTQPGTNFGWILIATGELAGSGKQIASREDPSNTPVLIISYNTPAQLMIFNVAQINNQIRFSFQAEANQAYSIEAKDSLTNTVWNQWLNIPAPSISGLLHVTNTINSAERYFRVKLADQILAN